MQTDQPFSDASHRGYTRASRRRAPFIAALAGVASFLALATIEVQAQAPTPDARPAAGQGRESGLIAWYGRRFAGRRTASGERFDPAAMTMAHRSLPFGTKVRVTHVESGRSVEVRVNDRGPTQPDRIGDLSLAAARSLGIVRIGVAPVELEVLAP